MIFSCLGESHRHACGLNNKDSGGCRGQDNIFFQGSKTCLMPALICSLLTARYGISQFQPCSVILYSTFPVSHPRRGFRGAGDAEQGLAWTPPFSGSCWKRLRLGLISLPAT